MTIKEISCIDYEFVREVLAIHLQICLSVKYSFFINPKNYKKTFGRYYFNVSITGIIDLLELGLYLDWHNKTLENSDGSRL